MTEAPPQSRPETPKSTIQIGPDKQHIALATFIQLEQEARHAKNLQELFFIIANETNRLILYHQVFVAKHDVLHKKLELSAISGVPDFERHAPYVLWLNTVLKDLYKLADVKKVQILSKADFSQKIQEEGKDWLHGSYAWVPLVDRHQHLQGGLLFLRLHNKWEQNELNLAERLADAYAHALMGLVPYEKARLKGFFKYVQQKKVWALILFFVMLVMFLPVTQSVLAPAEVTAEKPYIVTSPLEGVIKEFLIEPNASVEKGQNLMALDDTNLRNRLEIAKKSYEIALADYTRVRQQAFQDEKSKAQIHLLKSQVDEKLAEVNYNQDLLSKVTIKAERAGIAIFTTPSDWVGKPVVIGEKILQIADPREIDISIQLPIDEAIALKQGADVKFFLNTDPLSPLEGTLIWSSYEAKLTPNNSLAYQLRAQFKDLKEPVRIGLKGTAKLFGKKTTLFYYLFRRPLSTFRRFFGV